jgi:hypothetical protein
MKCILLTGCLVLATQVAQCEVKASASTQQPGVQASAPVSGFSGKVTETMNAANYTYVLVDTGTNKVWVAAPAFKVKVGDSAAVAQAMAMPKYHSKTLNRDFDVVYFAGGVVVNGVEPTAGVETRELPKNHPPITSAAAAPKVDLAGIKKAAGGKTVAEICGSKAKLGGQQVKVRGKVVKYNANILGKNWLHIRDGTGSEGSNDLVVTTSSAVKVGDTVLVSGAVSLNKDFGSGYKYAVMIDNAKVTVE